MMWLRGRGEGAKVNKVIASRPAEACCRISGYYSTGRISYKLIDDPRTEEVEPWYGGEVGGVYTIDQDQRSILNHTHSQPWMERREGKRDREREKKSVQFHKTRKRNSPRHNPGKGQD
jgi:hypothetical protein